MKISSSKVVVQNPRIEDKTTISLEQLMALRLSRREVLKGSLSLAMLGLLGTTTATAGSRDSLLSSFTFKPISIADGNDTVIPPEGYTAQVFFAWGDPISDGSEYKGEASDSAKAQAYQAGMHHDGMKFFPLPATAKNAEHGLLVMNHEYITPSVLHDEEGWLSRFSAYSEEKAEKELLAHGVSVIEVKKNKHNWEIVRPSTLARRITTLTPMHVSGAATGSRLLKTNADPTGKAIFGTNNNCSSGITPWGTYLTCEENIQHMFAGNIEDTADNKEIIALHKRYGIRRTKYNYGWDKYHARFDLSKEPNEPNRFGWIVEIDPYDPNSVPIKRTAMGRFKHENCACLVADNRRTAFYSGDDSVFEYIYKFVPNKAYDAINKSNNTTLLDEGTLYVARFNEDGTGNWLPLVHGKAGLTAENGFADQAEVLIKTRLAADKLSATPMDRPEWIDVHPTTHKVYCCLTNNSKRSEQETNKANPRANNSHGHIISWSETNNDPLATTFTWDIFLLAGNPASTNKHQQGTIKGDIFSSPDGLYIDPRGAIWIQTDISGSKLNKGDYAAFGNNQMLVADPETREVKRFLTGPVGCEVSGVTLSPDMKAMWVNMQHPKGHWPKGGKHRPRSATVLITKDDGGKIGT
ncbi:MAG TPA: PhoX family phosphatase [Thiothrix sp.]|nr:PhoX family phosphatase [Thiothrix sp.]